MAKGLYRSFAGGIITPEMYGRMDLTKFQTGLRDALNFITLPHGPAARRPGTKFVQWARFRKNSGDTTNKRVKLIPFIIDADNARVIELGTAYMRFHNAEGTELEAAKAVTAATVANPGVFTLVGHGYSTGDCLYVGSMPGMTSLEGRFYECVVVSSSTFKLRELHGSSATAAEISTVGLGPLSSNGSVARVYTLSASLSAASKIRYAQSGSVMSIASDSSASELRRYGIGYWLLSTTNFTVTLAAPSGLSVTPTIPTSTNPTEAKYVITSVAADGVTESVASASASATNNLNIAGNFNVITANPVDGATRYNVYKLRGGVYGYIGQITPATASSVSISTAEMVNYLESTDSEGRPSFPANSPELVQRVTVNTTTSHGKSTGDVVAISGTGVPYFDGVWAVTVVDADTFYFHNYSAPTYENFSTSTGTVTTPSLSMVDDNLAPDVATTPPLNDIKLNTTTGEYPRAVTYYESRRWFGGTANKPQNVWATRSATESNLTSSVPSRADDAFEVKISAQQHQSIQHLVALQDVVALTASGYFRIFADGGPAVAIDTLSIKPQGAVGANEVQPVLAEERALFVQAKTNYIRELTFDPSGVGRFLAENVSIMAPHLFDGFTITDLAYSSAPIPILWALRSDGALLGMTHMPGQQVYGWHRHTAADGDVESICVIPEDGEDVLYMAVRRSWSDGGSAVMIERLTPRVFLTQENAYFVDCGLTYSGSPATTISGLWHLEGRTVNILADGAVVSPQVVTNGRVTLTTAASVVHVGLGYVSDMQTLPQAYDNAPASGQGTMKNVSDVYIRVKDSSLVKAGPRFNALTQAKSRQVSDPYGSPPSLQTEEIHVKIGPSWNTDGSICIRQDQPLPLTVLAITHDTATGG